MDNAHGMQLPAVEVMNLNLIKQNEFGKKRILKFLFLLSYPGQLFPFFLEK